MTKSSEAIFSTEEMQAMREQYEMRVLEEEQKREQMEWKLRLALARLKEIEEGLRTSLNPDEEVPRRAPARPPTITSPRRARA